MVIHLSAMERGQQMLMLMLSMVVMGTGDLDMAILTPMAIDAASMAKDLLMLKLPQKFLAMVRDLQSPTVLLVVSMALVLE